MSVRRLAAWLLVALVLPTEARADEPGAVVVRVGAVALTVADVERRIALLPAFQLQALGTTDAERKRRFVEDFLVPELLYSADADARKLGERPRIRHRLRDALRRALVDALRAEANAATIPDEELRAYYDEHRDDYQRPERLRLGRIVVDDPELAKKIAAESRGKGGAERWAAFAREHSLDGATKLRAGNLGFVWPDGRTDTPQVHVDAALYAAATKVKDGELVPEPVPEGGHLAVVWRRGTLPAVERSFDAERAAIRELLVRKRTEAAVSRLRDELRARDVKDVNPAPIESLPADPPPGPPRMRPQAPAAHSLVPPRPGERGLR